MAETGKVEVSKSREEKIACLHELFDKRAGLVADLQDVRVEDNLSDLETRFEALKERRIGLFETQQKVRRLYSLSPATILREIGGQ